MVLQNYLPQVITVMKDIHDNDPSAGSEVVKLFGDLTPDGKLKENILFCHLDFLI